MSRCHVRTPRPRLVAAAALDPLPPNTCYNRARRRAAIAQRAQLLAKLHTRPFVQAPSVFTANTGEEAARQCFELGFSNVLGGQFPSKLSAGCTNGLGGLPGGSGKRYYQLSASLVDLNASLRPPNAVYQTPSVFVCENAECAATLCFEQGWSDALPSVQQSQRNQNCTLGLNGVSKTYGNLCPMVRRFGPDTIA